MSYMTKSAELLELSVERDASGLVFVECEQPALFMSLKQSDRFDDDLKAALEGLYESRNRSVCAYPMDGGAMLVSRSDRLYWTIIPCEERRVA